MKIKILEYKIERGNECKVQSHNLRKGKWVENPNFKLYKDLIQANPYRFRWHKEYEAERPGGEK
jgi:hypothetical protein